MLLYPAADLANLGVREESGHGIQNGSREDCGRGSVVEDHVMILETSDACLA